MTNRILSVLDSCFCFNVIEDKHPSSDNDSRVLFSKEKKKYSNWTEKREKTSIKYGWWVEDE